MLTEGVVEVLQVSIANVADKESIHNQGEVDQVCQVFE